MRITHFTKNTFSKHYLSIATFDKILQESGQNVKNLRMKEDDGIRPKRLTSLEKKVTLPKILFFDQPDDVSPSQRLKELNNSSPENKRSNTNNNSSSKNSSSRRKLGKAVNNINTSSSCRLIKEYLNHIHKSNNQFSLV